jgi:3-methyladenine DNA glycosylase AlkD
MALGMINGQSSLAVFVRQRLFDRNVFKIIKQFLGTSCVFVYIGFNCT